MSGRRSFAEDFKSLSLRSSPAASTRAIPSSSAADVDAGRSPISSSRAIPSSSVDVVVDRRSPADASTLTIRSSTAADIVAGRSPAAALTPASSTPATDVIARRSPTAASTRVIPSPSADVVSGRSSGRGAVEEELGGDAAAGGGDSGGAKLSREQRETIRFGLVKRKKDFTCMEKVKGKMINVLQGLELHTGVFSSVEQRRIVDCVYDFQEKGRKGLLLERTYSEPRKWMRGKGRITIQFGCCYNYSVDKNGNPPGIIRGEDVDPIPPLFKLMIKRMVSWHVLPPTCIPNSCIVNIYEKDDCIPPHIDHHDFVRPFCTVSFLCECNIVFGTELKIVGPGEFSGSISIPLPLGSVLVLNGNGADVSKHCVPAVPAKRISITFRKMDDSKLPYKFIQDPEMRNLQPLLFQGQQEQPSVRFLQLDHRRDRLTRGTQEEERVQKEEGRVLFTEVEFPPLSARRRGH